MGVATNAMRWPLGQMNVWHPAITIPTAKLPCPNALSFFVHRGQRIFFIS